MYTHVYVYGTLCIVYIVSYDSVKLKLLSSEGGDVREINKPYSQIQVSSNGPDLRNLTDDSTVSYWQSNGSARTHWIRLNMKPNVILKSLSINVASNDQSYMPKEVVVSVGKGDALREFREVRIPRYDAIVVRNLVVSFTYYICL